MTDARWQQVKALFEAAVERSPAERAAFLTAATGGDDGLRREIESLLNAAGSDPGFTDRLPFRAPSPLAGSSAEGLPSGERTQTSMAFSRDADIGPYRVIALLGTGGMGEVFRARDSKLHRDVALKVLPSAFAFDPDRLARFRREAQMLAALNHPHIAAIYGLEESKGRQALVLELVEGDTLATWIAAGPLPLAQALTMARQIAEALQAAHDKGIIHRDLKPANIKVTPAGVVKVLDFGLAKTAVDDLPLTTARPTPTGVGETQVGTILGTVAYMSPEQARGQEVDARTDVWAFGCVLFEMLAGRQVFAADAASDSVARILEQEPNWSALPKTTPAKIRQLLRQCLEKDRRRCLWERTPIGSVQILRTGVGGGIGGEDLPARQHLKQHAPERPHIGPRIDLLSPRLFRSSCTPPSRGWCPTSPPPWRPGGRQRQIVRAAGFANPKSRSFRARRATLVLSAGLRSRWMMPLWCRAPGGLRAIFIAIVQPHLGKRQRAGRDPGRRACRLQPVRAPTLAGPWTLPTRRSPQCGRLSAASICASRLKRARRPIEFKVALGSSLAPRRDAICVACAEHLPHPAVPSSEMTR